MDLGLVGTPCGASISDGMEALNAAGAVVSGDESDVVVRIGNGLEAANCWSVWSLIAGNEECNAG